MKTDILIRKDVMDELGLEPLLKANEIGVAVKNGIVTLSGMVDTYTKKITAEQAAQRVAGVRAIAEDIVVKPGGNSRKTDSEIAEAVMNALKWHSAVQEDRIRVKVEDGFVTLEGEVEWEFQKNSAQYMVENLQGVSGITNKITLIPTVSHGDVKRSIHSSFHRHATLDANKIIIQSEGNKVVLNGTVRSFAEKKDAENAAWLVPGVNKVENKLKIESGIVVNE
jgi:osmotically-inducible protein OsmY